MDRIGKIEPNKNPNNSFLPRVQLLYRTIIFFNMFRLTFRNTQIPSFYTCYLRGATFFMIQKITYCACFLIFYNTNQRKDAVPPSVNTVDI